MTKFRGAIRVSPPLLCRQRHFDVNAWSVPSQATISSITHLTRSSPHRDQNSVQWGSGASELAKCVWTFRRSSLHVAECIHALQSALVNCCGISFWPRAKQHIMVEQSH